MVRLTDNDVRPGNELCRPTADVQSPAALATRVALADCARALVLGGAWVGAALVKSIRQVITFQGVPIGFSG